MIPPRAHVGLYKALISIIVIGICIDPVTTLVINFSHGVFERLGPVEGTRGGVFDAVGIGLNKAVEDGLLNRPAEMFATVALVAAIALFFFPVPKVLQPVFDGKLP